MPKLVADFETSGLDPVEDAPLEFAMVVTDDQLNILAERSFLFRYTQTEIEEIYGEAHERVVKMHEKNGLWEDLLASSGEHSVAPDALGREVGDFLDLLEHEHVEVQKLQLAGFNPFFDRKWLEAFAPDVLERIHYRSYDVSTLRTTAQDLAFPDPPRGEVPHRSLGDCHAVIEYARWVRRSLTPLGS